MQAPFLDPTFGEQLLDIAVRELVITSAGNRNPANAERGGDQGRDRAAMLHRSSLPGLIRSTNATDPTAPGQPVQPSQPDDEQHGDRRVVAAPGAMSKSRVQRGRARAAPVSAPRTAARPG